MPANPDKEEKLSMPSDSVLKKTHFIISNLKKDYFPCPERIQYFQSDSSDHSTKETIFQKYTANSMQWTMPNHTFST